MKDKHACEYSVWEAYSYDTTTHILIETRKCRICGNVVKRKIKGKDIT